ncbi:hypothetical protein D5086_032660 [Populus alba]|uniref:Uncharacterized protein n=1 Tax=Populus alba TaxID=43335 RepID=A0ACC4AEN5_POPAL
MEPLTNVSVFPAPQHVLGSLQILGCFRQEVWTVNNAFKTCKDMDHPKSMMDVALIQMSDPVDIGLGSSEKGTTVVPTKRKKTMTSVYLIFFETAPDGMQVLWTKLFYYNCHG